MNDTKSIFSQRELCQQRDREFLALYSPTLDALLQHGVPTHKARRMAAEFTILNGRPHYHVDHERAYRCVCATCLPHVTRRPPMRSPIAPVPTWNAWQKGACVSRCGMKSPNMSPS